MGAPLVCLSVDTYLVVNDLVEAASAQNIPVFIEKIGLDMPLCHFP